MLTLYFLISSNVCFLLLDKPINVKVSIIPPNPNLNQLIQISCSSVANPEAISYIVTIGGLGIGQVSTGTNITRNVTSCAFYNAYVQCIGTNKWGSGVPAQQFLVVKGMLDHFQF